MIEITNTTFQFLFIPFKTPFGVVDVSIGPKRTISLPETYSSKILQTLIKRRQVRVKRVIKGK
jgi:hypothetical protein